MDKGLKILKQIYDEMGTQIDSLVRDYPSKQFINEYEGQVIVDHRFRQLIEIISDNSYVEYREAIKPSEVRLINRRVDATLSLIKYALDLGNTPCVMRADLLIFILRGYSISRERRASELLNRIINKKRLYIIEKSIVNKIKFKFKHDKNNIKVVVDEMDLVLLAIVTGKTKDYMLNMIDESYNKDVKNKSVW